jgi:hypothetical protein
MGVREMTNQLSSLEIHFTQDILLAVTVLCAFYIFVDAQRRVRADRASFSGEVEGRLTRGGGLRLRRVKSLNFVRWLRCMRWNLGRTAKQKRRWLEPVVGRGEIMNVSSREGGKNFSWQHVIFVRFSSGRSECRPSSVDLLVDRLLRPVCSRSFSIFWSCVARILLFIFL